MGVHWRHSLSSLAVSAGHFWEAFRVTNTCAGGTAEAQGRSGQRVRVNLVAASLAEYRLGPNGRYDMAVAAVVIVSFCL
ncbi:hypothetical protein GLOTRDRAFT_111070 [Gloeophyllum trabeum ATCC 11539]|uniref:Uncharacterized protein n=1 Tax=Gloeophyllum trabeum (strain ATCC 11539 / FP-39264 / Madison 617) TaxID=670483 RepID=S7RSK1_GLOTA|nr:uncharacterized protein GLOTRDRAFT_111070 [Gloeophyllum trabeum ATCC 11539]EPQ55989.1 hypothetical protein GLOTRDRAFT_111070 [Gloeophyllum trabeum ATCC 11539]